MKISTTEPEAGILSWSRVECPLLIRNKLLPQMDVFKYLWDLGVYREKVLGLNPQLSLSALNLQGFSRGSLA